MVLFLEIFLCGLLKLHSQCMVTLASYPIETKTIHEILCECSAGWQWTR